MKKHIESVTPFWAAVKQVKQGEATAPKVVMGGGEIDYFGYQLSVAKFELSLNAKGIKPRRHWKVSDLKNYYGLTGKGEQLVEQIKEIMEMYRYACHVLEQEHQ